MTSGEDPIQPLKDTQKVPSARERLPIREELPDYEEEESSPDFVEPVGPSKSKSRAWLFISFFLLIAALLASPLYRSLKNWRADTLLKKSSSDFAYGDNERGMSLMKQALALAPGSESVLHAVELFNARRGDKASINKLLSRMEAGTSSRGELLGIAEAKIKQGNREVVNQALAKLPSHLDPIESLRLVLIRAMIKNQESGPAGAAAFCLANAASASGKEAAYLRNQAALYLLSDNEEKVKKEGAELLLGLMRERTKLSLPAARVLAWIALQSNQNAAHLVTHSEAAEVAGLLTTLPGQEPKDKLLAADLEIHNDPALKPAVVKKLIAEYQNASRSQMLDFARWLNTKGLHEEVIRFAGNERPRNDTDWLLIVLDAKTAMGDWGGISDMLNTPAGLGIPDAVKHLFLARIAMQTGDTATAEDEWRSVSGSLHLEKPETLAYIAGYEEEIGARDQLIRTYQEMVDRKETHLIGLLGLIRSQPRSAQADSLIPLYESLLAGAPDISDAAGDLAYLKLLANKDIIHSSAVAEKLHAAQPQSLARISIAALGRLRNGDTKGALALYQNQQIDWTTSPDSWKVIRVAVLREGGEMAQVQSLLSTINFSSLNPQEKELLNLP